ncbi:DUF2147 domain-containing protein [Allomuricauda sp. F6463D]|uniref:DUF2147 domain-containing protein n=1 Tax=Allomuricauda sp. F6463D TaxID=2926409 RepID=UPI001FF387A5|nr:DUF2147 domain-containing protein [Muricauda sp. F6463D]MCK0159862.1 DUF2147 domain-containing protein [Muricauda sp. F6463D]
MKDRKIGYKWIYIICFLLCQMTWSQSVFGKWKTIDDRNGITKAIIEIYKEGDLMHAKVVKILEEGKKDALCTKCKGDLKDKPILGMKIMEDFEKNSKGIYKGDRLFDPEQAMTFKGRVWLDEENEDRLKVRGYLAFLYRTQTWHRVVEN